MKKRYPGLIKLGLLSILTLWGCDMPNNSTPPVTGLPEQTDLKSVLANLEVNTTVEPRKNAFNEPVRADYNPLGKRIVKVKRNSDIYMAGVRVTGKTYNEALFDVESRTELTTDPEGSWAKEMFYKLTPADLDGNGLEEIVTVIFDVNQKKVILRKKDYSKTSGTYSSNVEFASYEESGLTQAAINATVWQFGDITAGDLNGDGQDEILVTFLSKLLIVKKAGDGYQIFVKEILPVTTGTQQLKVRTGDFDQDGKDEIAVVNGIMNSTATGKYLVFDDILADPGLSSPLDEGFLSAQAILWNGDNNTRNAASISFSIETANIAVGDFNGDNIPDIALGGNRTNAGQTILMLLQTSIKAGGDVSFTISDTGAYDGFNGSFPAMDAGDLDGDGRDEIVLFDTVYKLDQNGKMAELGNGDVGALAFQDSMKIGDVNGDGKYEVVTLRDNREDVVITVYNTSTAKLETSVIPSIDVQGVHNNPYAALCLPAVRKGSLVLEYLGHEVQYTEPRILAAIAAPPYYGSLDGKEAGEVQPHVDNLVTTFGKSKGEENATSKSFGFNVSYSLGMSADVPLLGKIGGGIEVKNTISTSFDWTSANATEQSFSCSYENGVNNGLSDNMVIFSVIPFDVYYYKVLNSDSEQAIGKTITVNLPKKPITTNRSATLYNAQNGDYFDVGPEVFKHTIGSPGTYPTSSDMETLKVAHPHGMFITKESGFSLHVGEGISSKSISIQDVKSKSNSFDFNLGIEREHTVVISGILMSNSFGFNFGYSSSTTLTEGTEISGAVADLTGVHFKAERAFEWGLMAYPYSNKAPASNGQYVNSETFTVVTYWVDMPNS